VRTVEALRKEGGSREYDIIVLPGVDHSFVNHETRTQVPVVRIVINWLKPSFAGE